MAKRCERKHRLLLIIARKSHIGFQMTWKLSTLAELEGYWPSVRSAILATAGLLVIFLAAMIITAINAFYLHQFINIRTKFVQVYKLYKRYTYRSLYIAFKRIAETGALTYAFNSPLVINKTLCRNFFTTMTTWVIKQKKYFAPCCFVFSNIEHILVHFLKYHERDEMWANSIRPQSIQNVH